MRRSLAILFVITIFCLSFFLFRINQLSVNLKVPEQQYSAIKVYDDQGIELFSLGGERNTPISIDETPKLLTDIIRIAEDEDFYTHNGVSYKSIFRAMIKNFSHGKIVQGGSTISQQVVKNIYLNSKKTFDRKFKELLITFQLEKTFSKDKIMNLYVNNIYLGQGNWGFSAAAEYYFGKQLKDLSVVEMCYLVNLIPAPSTYSKISSKRTQKRNKVKIISLLKKLKKAKVIDIMEYSSALNDPLKFSIAINPSYSFMRQLIVGKLESIFSREIKDIKSINVYTSISKKLQDSLLDQSRRIISGEFKDKYLAFLSVQKNGEIKSYGGISSGLQFDIIKGGYRSIGRHSSSFIFSSALNRGYHASTDLYQPSRSINFKIEDGRSLFSALHEGELFENLRLAYQVGRKNLEHDLGLFGFNKISYNDLFTTGLKASLFSLSEAYNVINNEGTHVDLHIIKKITTTTNKPLYSAMPRSYKALSISSAYIAKYMMFQAGNISFCSFSDKKFNLICNESNGDLMTIKWLGSAKRKNFITINQEKKFRAFNAKPSLGEVPKGISMFMLNDNGNRTILPHRL